MRKVYLHNIPKQEALKIFLSGVKIPRRKETIAVADALGRVTAAAVFARLSMPGYHAAAMDGIAVRAENTFGTSDQAPLTLVEGASFAFVDTGDPLPPGYDAVIKIEDVHLRPDRSAEILAPATPWQYVRAVGEDVVACELIVPAFHRLRPPDLGAILAGGIMEIEVLARPEVMIIPSGSEIVSPEADRDKGDVPDFNSSVVSAYLQEWGALPEVHPIVPDEPAQIKAAVEQAANKADMLIVIAGSSAGSKDFTYAALAEQGEVYVHGVATRPGKPTILGAVGGKPAVGLPGYPVSAYLSLEWFVRPLLCRYHAICEPERERLEVTLGRRLVSEMGTEEYVRMAVGKVNGEFVANPLTRGAGVTMSLVRADGLLVIPPEKMGYEQNERIRIELYRPARELDHNLLAGGSHDLVLDLLATALRERGSGFTLSSAHLGSMGGILAIDKGQAHLAGVHLFDPASGEYNIPYIRKFLPGKDVVLVTLAHRMQGWIVPRGNPEGIRDITDIVHNKTGFVNRQKGAGTRLLFDYLLGKAGIEPQEIYGYEREEHTHLNVAAAVASGTASVGLGILPAAKAFGLDFVPVREERYDLLMMADFYASSAGQAINSIIKDPAFKDRVTAMGGYSMRETGTLRRVEQLNRDARESLEAREERMV